MAEQALLPRNRMQSNKAYILVLSKFSTIKKYHFRCNKEFVFAKTDDLAFALCFQVVVFIRLEHHT